MITTIFTKPVLRFISVFLTVLMLTEFFIPVSLYALSSGPTQPEFSSFEPVATTNMVDNFSGSFNYNLPVIEIPGPHGSSYPLSLSYHSGASPEDEATWVGYGWNINPGAINRSVRGYPDDDLGVKVERYMNTGFNYTVTVAPSVALSVSGSEIGGTFEAALRYNNYKGWGYGVGLDANYNGFSFGFNVTDGNSNWSAAIDPARVATKVRDKPKDNSGDECLSDQEKEAEKARVGVENQERQKELDKAESRKQEWGLIAGFVSGLLSKGTSYSGPMQEFTGVEVDAKFSGITVDFLPAPFGPTGPSTGVQATYTSSSPRKSKDLSAYGYIYSGAAQARKTNKAKNECVSMDRYRERDIAMRDHYKYMPIPFNNPDIYSVSGEGVGGNFRFHHREIGDNLPEYSESEHYRFGVSGKWNGGAKYGLNLRAAAGYKISNLKSNEGSEVKKYTTDAQYRNIGSGNTGGILKEDGVFPRFVGDLGGSIIYDQQLNELSSPTGGTSTTYDRIVFPGDAGLTMNSSGNSSFRSGRSSNISYNTIGTMKKDPKVCYTKDVETRRLYIREEDNGSGNSANNTPAEKHFENIVKDKDGNPLRTKNIFLPDNAIGEFAIYVPDGRCYVYGLPVLAREEKRMSNIKGNGNGDQTGEYRQSVYATKYLLTQILNPDYIDVSGDGPSPDDLGGWVKFSYKQCTLLSTESNRVSWAHWRIPFKGEIYDKNKIHDPKDDTYSWTEGEKQTYVLERVETATHIAFFVTNKTKIINYPISDNENLTIEGSRIERADAYQYGYGKYSGNDVYHTDNQAILGEWNSEWKPIPDAFGNTEFTDPQNPNVWYIANNYYINGGMVGREDGTGPSYPNFSENLERIELYKKGDKQPIKTVRFEYDYTSFHEEKHSWLLNCNGVVLPKKLLDDQGKEYDNPDVCAKYPNKMIQYYQDVYGLPNSAMYPSVANVIPASQRDNITQLFRYGKLTLKKVWFEYGGILNAKISPYIFEYEYPNMANAASSSTSNSVLLNKYPTMFTQNYGYTYDNIIHKDVPNLKALNYVAQAQDAWGYYSESPYVLSDKNHYGVNWVSQRPSPFDPAPYYLKVIKLPSGGEIRVQYEENDYAYVQDRPAMAMVSLFPGDDNNINKFYLNTNDLGINDMNTVEKNLLVRKITALYKDKEKIGFKFLFRFGDDGSNLDEPLYQNIAAEPDKDRDYVSGYSDVVSVGIETGSGSHNGQVFIELHENTNPMTYALEYWKTNIAYNRSSFEKQNIMEAIKSVVDSKGFTFLHSSPNTKYYNRFSYLRVPVTRAKRGGGSRVKRILMYDQGDKSIASNQTGVVNEGGAVLYGQEYIYKTLDDKTVTENGIQMMISSGVATNEPSQLHQENPLVTFMEGYNERSWLHKPIAGETLDIYEGPLGESLLPNASIGYSKVIVRNIHTGKTAPGFTINDYYTYKDRPFINRDEANCNELIKDMTIPPLSLSYFGFSLETGGEDKIQGYRFCVNSLHGHLRSSSLYNGVLNFGSTQEDLEDKLRSIGNLTPIETVEYEYFAQKELLPLFKDENTIISSSLSLNGVEMDMALETSKYKDESYNLGLDADFGLGPNFPWIYGSLGSVGAGFGLTQINSTAISKVISYPTVLKKITTKRDGMVHIVENIAFSPYTGQPVVKMITDEFDGTKPAATGSSILTGTTILYEIPAASKYAGMGQKSENEHFALSKSVTPYTISTAGTGIDLTITSTVTIPFHLGDILTFFVDTDEKNPDDYQGAYIVESIQGGTYHLEHLQNSSAPDLNAPGIITKNDRVVVARSGKTNQLSAVAGTVALYGKTRDQVRDVSLATHAQSTTKHSVLSASATTYSDDWDYSWSGGYTSSITNPYESGARGKWRPKETYIYRDETTPSVGTGNRVYGNSGTMSGTFTVFNWEGTNGAKWLKTNTITHYSKHGEPVEEMDINEVFSSARFSHDDAVPSMIASNSKYMDMHFESYEDNTTSATSNKAHTGNKAKLVNSSPIELLPVSTIGDYIVKLWTTCETPPQIGGVDMTKVSRSGEWILYEKLQTTTTANTVIQIMFSCSGGGSNYVDDIRIQPKGAQSTCYVYDNRNLRLLAQFDDQHFASIFQYNSEGKLIRKLKETMRGVKTIAETNYYTPTIDRPIGYAGKGAAKYVALTALKANTTVDQNSKSKDVYVKDVLNSIKTKNVKDLISYPTNDRISNMIERKKKSVIDTMPIMKFDLMNIHLTPEQLNAKIIGVDTIKVNNPKK